MALSSEDKRYYDAMFELTSREGWLYLQEDAKEKMEALKDTCMWSDDPQKIAENRGAYQVWYSLFHLRDGLEAGYQQATQTEEEHDT